MAAEHPDCRLPAAACPDVSAALRLAYQPSSTAGSLSTLPSTGLSCLDGPAPALSDVLADRAGPILEVLASRLSARP